MSRWMLWFLAGALWIPTPGGAEAFRSDDICAPVTLDDPRLAPDGSAVVFVVRTCDMATNESTSDLWYVGTEPGAEPRRLTTDPADEWSPRWSPDGSSLAFVSTRAMGPQIWRFDGFFGEPHQVTHQPGGATGPLWTPDGEQLLYSSRGARVEKDELAGEDVGVHRDLLYRKGSDREDGRFWKVACNYIPANYPGTGDAFTSTVTGCLLHGDSLPIALDRAVQFISFGIRATFGHACHTREGILLERVLDTLKAPVPMSSYELL